MEPSASHVAVALLLASVWQSSVLNDAMGGVDLSLCRSMTTLEEVFMRIAHVGESEVGQLQPLCLFIWPLSRGLDVFVLTASIRGWI
jgi:hypothetical protein